MERRVSEYLNYREFLKDFFQSKKNHNPNFSYKLFGTKAGFQSKNTMAMVISGKRNLAIERSTDIAKACGLTGPDAAYLVALIGWNQAATEHEKTLYWSEMMACVPHDSFSELKEEQTRVLSLWYTVAILEMIRLKDYEPHPEWFAKRLGRKVSPEQAAAALKLLVETGLLELKDGHYVSPSKKREFEAKVPTSVVNMYHHRVIHIGLKALAEEEFAQKEFSAACIPVRKESVAKLRAEIKAFQRRIMELTAVDTDADEVYQINVQCFPLTKRVAK